MGLPLLWGGPYQKYMLTQGKSAALQPSSDSYHMNLGKLPKELVHRRMVMDNLAAFIETSFIRLHANFFSMSGIDWLLELVQTLFQYHL